MNGYDQYLVTKCFEKTGSSYMGMGYRLINVNVKSAHCAGHLRFWTEMNVMLICFIPIVHLLGLLFLFMMHLTF